eukprot:TRINITY_DN10641_c0_g1_i1.p1 TRINITY_DN10641_c0_g1~~TRINITY_DN10641_c0_g1_i1.p1  ORF type:complete len:242 (-),score=35.19 TRINITY_DN10641_c0_g1_i1:231-956(-)
MSSLQLPDELVELIFASTSDATLCRAAAVCKTWNTVADGCWKSRAERISSDAQSSPTWQRAYYELISMKFGRCDPEHSVLENNGLIFHKFDGGAWSAALLNRPIARTQDHFYFEIQVLQTEMRQIQIGITGAMQQRDWTQHICDHENGFGYYGKTGGYNSIGQTANRGPEFGNGDRVGCYVDFINEHIVYYVNDKPTPPAFAGEISHDKIPGPIYGAVSLSNGSDKVQILQRALHPKQPTN